MIEMGFGSPPLALSFLTPTYGIETHGNGRFNDWVEEEGQAGRYDIRV